ncbi:MAG: hypothetical protein GQ538_10650 [Xanthomonadales bacterium]|nr:hypothetical protein [Xanthomonadales bacterium]
MKIGKYIWLLLTLFLLSTGCDKQSSNQTAELEPQPVSITRSGWLASNKLDEASGIQTSYSREGDFFVHNDEGKPVIYAVDETGADLGLITVVPAKNKDWEDITSVPVDDGRWLVIGDIGDNWSRRKSIKLYFIEEPQTGKDDRYAGRQELKHWLSLTYPDGPRDCESMAYDPVGKQILLLSKRDKPPRLYALDLETALSKDQAVLKFLGPTSKLRPPTPSDRHQWGGRTDWISQPTGFDISADGTEAVVITYRSLYRYHRKENEDWLTAMQRKPEEVVGPPAVQNEAITYSIDGKAIYVTTEKRPTPIHRVIFDE